VQIQEDILAKCHSHGVEEYPEEACGFIIGVRGDPDSLETVWPMRNIMNELHEKDPDLYFGTARDAYLIDPLEQLKLERLLKKEGKEIKIIYNSHPDVGAYFSEKIKRIHFGMVRLDILESNFWSVEQPEGNQMVRLL
tara:strand:- start:5472 stop:5885 length:414 start_codon:yes stop_codon:yes gene_type:complete